jgi:hypothetical protein
LDAAAAATAQASRSAQADSRLLQGPGGSGSGPGDRRPRAAQLPPLARPVQRQQPTAGSGIAEGGQTYPGRGGPRLVQPLCQAGGLLLGTVQLVPQLLTTIQHALQLLVLLCEEGGRRGAKSVGLRLPRRGLAPRKLSHNSGHKELLLRFEHVSADAS